MGGHRTELCLKSKTELSVAKALSFIGGDTAHSFFIEGTIGEEEGGHRTTLTEKIFMVGWVGGWGIPSGNIATLWLHLAR